MEITIEQDLLEFDNSMERMDKEDKELIKLAKKEGVRLPKYLRCAIRLQARARKSWKRAKKILEKEGVVIKAM